MTQQQVMEEALFKHIRTHTKANDPVVEDLKRYFDCLRPSKKEILLPSHTICNRLYFVSSGCLRAFFTDENGVEKTVQFALENWWISDFLAFHHRRPTDTTIQAIEPSEVLSISYDNFQRLLIDHPFMEHYFRRVWEIGYGATVTRVKYLFSHSKEDIFYRFREQYPEFANRVPQYMLATFLGLTPEYLSKLRAKKRS